MNALLRAETEELRRTTERLQRVGLIVDRHTLSRSHRRAFFALQCQLACEPELSDTGRTPIGFAYPPTRPSEPCNGPDPDHVQ